MTQLKKKNKQLKQRKTQQVMHTEAFFTERNLNFGFTSFLEQDRKFLALAHF